LRVATPKRLSEKPPSTAVQAVPSAAGLANPQLRSMLLRLGIPVLAVWILALGIGSFTRGWVTPALFGAAGLVTALALAVVIWALLQTRKARRVASLLGQAGSAEDRKAALTELEQNYKKGDPAAVFARAQLELQDDPKRALLTLEQIDLKKVMPNIADEARAQRAMIHLMLGQVTPARPLVDGIELKRHEDPRSRAMMVAVMAECWARGGQAKKAHELLELYDPKDAAFEQIRPQLFRARAYAAVGVNDVKGMRRALRSLLEQDPRLLAGFLGKKTHPLLMREAKKMLEQSGAIPRRMIVQRH